MPLYFISKDYIFNFFILKEKKELKKPHFSSIKITNDSAKQQPNSLSKGYDDSILGINYLSNTAFLSNIFSAKPNQENKKSKDAQYWQLSQDFTDSIIDYKMVFLRDTFSFHKNHLKEFYIGQTEVTQKQWERIMGDNPSHFSNCDDCPVENVNYNDIQLFLKELNRRTNKNYRLPTADEWQFAALGKVKSEVRPFLLFGAKKLSEIAWWGANSKNKTHPVATKAANNYKLYDMFGNVEEWSASKTDGWKGHYMIFGSSYYWWDEYHYDIDPCNNAKVNSKDEMTGFRIAL
ncbi:formylglycine-generating enzyme family protein [Taibaiella koreensis]|uniref:formylglycine-generating enzyme family protein n=1 Tax=Taibaiella koreensis TaxID=1268548 RepID=UPI000E59ED76|nr:SUMF1/EgtB/PvdO family nonheme iron enzyme [Taibaiella koreensis]